MDLYDRAALYEQQEREAALIRQRWRHQSARRVANTHCDDCGGIIPTARRLAVSGCTRCVICQSRAEAGGK